MKTAIDNVIDYINKHKELIGATWPMIIDKLNLEKQTTENKQISEAFAAGEDYGFRQRSTPGDNDLPDAEEYYNLKYGTK